MTVEAAVAFPSRCTVASYGDSPGQFGGRDVNEGVRSKSGNRGVVGGVQYAGGEMYSW